MSDLCKKPSQIVFRILNSAERLLLQRDWTGLNITSPVISHYTLKKTEQCFSGKAFFSVGTRLLKSLSYMEKIQIKQSVMNHFFRMLEKITISNGEYQPFLDHTDDYPSLLIKIKSPFGLLILQSKSQGAGHIPWELSVDKEDYIINEDIPDLALRYLERYMRTDKLNTLVEAYENLYWDKRSQGDIPSESPPE